MYIKYSPDEWTTRTYRTLKSLTFAPETDLTLSSIPVNEFQADIITADQIPVGAMVELRDDLDNLWARFRVMKQERVDNQTLRVLAQSELALLDAWTMPSNKYTNVPVNTFIYWMMTESPASGRIYGGINIDVDPAFNSARIDGFVPEQTARERLQWALISIGGMLKQSFTGTMTIVEAPILAPNTSTAQLIPLSDTFAGAEITHKEPVTTLSVTGYDNFKTYIPEEQSGWDWESIEDSDGTTWYYTKAVYDLENEDAEDLTGQTVTISDDMLISNTYAMQTLIRLSRAYFRQTEITVDVINNAQYVPGQKVRVYTDENTVYGGWIKSCSFTFGVQARSRLVISADDEPMETAVLTFIYKHSFEDNYGIHGFTLGQRKLVLPVNESYRVEHPTISVDVVGELVPYVPNTAVSTGILSANTTLTILYRKGAS